MTTQMTEEEMLQILTHHFDQNAIRVQNITTF